MLPGNILRLRTRDFPKTSKTLKSVSRSDPTQKLMQTSKEANSSGRAGSALACLTGHDKTCQASSIAVLSSNKPWKIAFAAHTGCYTSARSAPEAKFLQNPQNCQNWRNSAEFLKISKTLGCRCAQVPKYILRAAEVAISQKFS